MWEGWDGRESKQGWSTSHPLLNPAVSSLFPSHPSPSRLLVLPSGWQSPPARWASCLLQPPPASYARLFSSLLERQRCCSASTLVPSGLRHKAPVRAQPNGCRLRPQVELELRPALVSRRLWLSACWDRPRAFEVLSRCLSFSHCGRFFAFDLVPCH